MKYIYIFMLSIMCAYSQNGNHYDEGEFLKRIEYNRFYNGNNLNSKNIGEKRLLDNFNAPVEFFFDPSAEMREKPSAFRIMRDSLSNKFILEYKTYKNVESIDINDEIVKHSFIISDQFAETIYKKMVSLIENFKARGETDSIILDGYIVTFRNVVEVEVWSLKIHEPSGNALKMSDLCRQILKDADVKKLDEAKYIKILDGFDFERRKPNN